MYSNKIGQLIYNIRIEKGWTQKQLADEVCISDKTVSKWERGAGCPDISLLSRLCELLGIELEALISGKIIKNEETGGNMKNTQFYICPQCGNIITAVSNAQVSCCGKKLQSLNANKACDEEKLSVEVIDNE